jgi:hypothetical protein
LQVVDQFAYYAVVTASAERAAPGCPAAVRDVLANTLAAATAKDEIASKLGLCDPLPLYLQEGSLDLLVDEINMIVMYTCKPLPSLGLPSSRVPLCTAV